MAKRLSEDEIKWILSVESTEAQQKIHALTKENKELTAANKQRLQEMIKLEKQGQKESAAYKNLQKVIDDNTSRIKKNSATIDALTGNLKTAELTMSQLRKRASELQRQLDSTSKATHPEQYNALDRKLRETRSRMDELKGSSKQMHSGFQNIKQLLPTISFVGIIAGMTALAKSSTDAGLESEKNTKRLLMAVKNVAKGTDEDFNRLINQANELMGIFDDDDIVKAQTSMINFGVSIETVENIMPLMIDAASASGATLQEMAESIDKGIQSGVMARSALGKLGMAFKSTGDYTKNFQIILDGLTKYTGSNSQALSENWGQVEEARVKWDNFKETLGGVLLKGIVPIIDGITSLNQLLESSDKKQAASIERIAAARLDDFKTSIKLDKDKKTEIAREVKAEESLYRQKLNKINILKSEVAQSDLSERSARKKNKQILAEIANLENAASAHSLYLSKLNSYKKQLDNPLTPKFNFIDVEDELTSKEITAPLDRKQKIEENALKQKYAKGEILEKEYNEKLLDIQVKFLEQKRDLFGKETSEYADFQSQLIDIELTKRMNAEDALRKVIEDSNKATQEATKQYEITKRRQLQSDLEKKIITEDEYNSRSIALDIALSEMKLQTAKDYAELINDAKYNSEEEKQRATETANQAVTAATEELLKAQDAANKNKLKLEKDHLDKVDKLRKELGLDKEVLSYKAGLDALKQKLKEAEATEKESIDAISKYKLKKAQDYADKASFFVDTVSKFVTSAHEAEASSLEAAKQRELTAAGTSAEARAAVEQKYAQKELDLKKSQADANMGVSIAQALAEGALGIAKIWAEQGVNPIYAGILTAILAGVTTMQIKTAVQQRNAIRSMSLGSSSNSRPSAKLTGLESGGYIDVVRAQDGKTFSNAVYDPGRRGRIDRPTVLVGEKPEYVLNNDTVQNPTFAPLLSIIDKHQQAGTIRTLDFNKLIRPTMIGLESGGSIQRPVNISRPSPAGESQNPTGLSTLIAKLYSLIDKLYNEGLSADVSLSALEKKKNLRDKSRKIGSK